MSISSSSSTRTASSVEAQGAADSQLESRFAVDSLPSAKPRLTWLLGRDPDMRIGLLRTLAAIGVFVWFVVLVAFGVDSGWIRPDYGQILAGLILSSCVFFYVAIRSGWSRKFSDPALTLFHVLTAETWICVAYAVSHEAHGATLILFALVMFFGIFNMDTRSAYISGGYVVVAAGLTILYKSTTDPFYYSARLEVVYYLFLVATVPMMVYLSSQLTSMRNRMRAQKRELEAAVERIHQMAVRDELTGLINRRQALLVLQEYKTLLKRNNLGLWVALIDLDHFKRVNDTWGHSVGDEVLKGFARLASTVLRSADVVARWGGEEFLVVMLEEPGEDPNVGIERLRTRLHDHVVSASVPDLRMGFSSGLARCLNSETIEATIDRADQALYEAKNKGRSCSVVSRLGT